MLFNAPPTGQLQIVTTAAVFLGISWITLGLRFWVRLVVIKNPGWDDVVLLLTALIFTGFCTSVILVETIGGANRANDLNFAQLIRLVGMVIAALELYIATMVVFKISLAIFYLRIVIRTWQRYVVIGACVINTIYGVFLFFTALFNCGNPSNYLLNEVKGACLSDTTTNGIQLAGCILNAATDGIFALLPVSILYKAAIPLPAKFLSGFILLLACGGSIVSVIRIRYIDGLVPGPDFFSTMINLCILSIVECGVGISAASAATLRPLFRSLMEQVRPVITSQGSNAVKGKSSPGYSVNARSSHVMSPPPENHELFEFEDRDYVSRFSRWSDWRLGSAQKGLRAKGRLATTGTDVHVPESNQHTAKYSVAYEVLERDTSISPVRQLPPPLEPPQPPPKSGEQVITRKLSVGDRGMSAPISHIASQISPTTASHMLSAVNVDRRGRGSPDWEHPDSDDLW